MKQEHVLDIKEQSLDLPVGESKAIHCPVCGFTQKATMSVTRQTLGLLYVCHRVSCSASGFISSVGVIHSKKEREFKPKVFDYPTRPFARLEIEAIKEKWDISVPPDWRVSGAFMVMPVKDVRGYEWGTYTKRLRGEGLKTILYPHTEFKPRLHCPSVLSDSVYVVEDPISAERIAQAGIPVICILGTSMNSRAATYLHNIGVTNLKLALDADAFLKAKKIQKEYSLLFPGGIEVLTWESKKDPKDMSSEEFNEGFHE